MTRRGKIVKRAAFTAVAAIVHLSCGSSPTPVPVVVDHVKAVVFLDENRNGIMDPVEDVRIPGVEISIGSVTARSVAHTGEVTFDVARGSYAPSVLTSSLPPYYDGASQPFISTTNPSTIPIPIMLPAGAVPLQQTVYVAFGDSITNGDRTVGDGLGYRGSLAKTLRDTFGVARVENEGINGSDTYAGVRRVSDVLGLYRPQFILILYGTNDWNDPACHQSPCFTIENLKMMIDTSKAFGARVFLGTMIPTNVAFGDVASDSRNDWIKAQNNLIADLAKSEGAVLVDLHKAFDASPLGYRNLFNDALHPSAEGYDLMSQTWANAILKR